ncbi:MAG: glycosyltransferase family 2 protein [Chitinophagales bacterium]|jgi:glycosyltransferase involved in cell wall biosynthesis|nr:glycosyltransferase family 2 protein [Chitinophagales bacterium]
MDLSIVVPLYNEEESLRELVEWIARVCQGRYEFEVLLVDDGSRDKSWEVIESLAQQHPWVLGVKFLRNYGKSAALNTGFGIAKGNVVITMDADLQDSPDEIPELYDMIINQGFDLVSGWKRKRHDPLSKTIPTKLFNWATRKMSGIYLHDFNCGLKAYKLKVVKSIDVYGEMHRYIPVIAKWQGFSKITEKVVAHQPRKYGVTKFGLERFVFGFLDLMTISFVSRFMKRPMHFFGSIGALMTMIGFFLALGIGINKIYCLYYHVPAILVVKSPFFYIALTLMIIGSQLFLAGFLAELISRSTLKNDYLIEDKVNLN